MYPEEQAMSVMVHLLPMKDVLLATLSVRLHPWWRMQYWPYNIGHVVLEHEVNNLFIFIHDEGCKFDHVSDGTRSVYLLRSPMKNATRGQWTMNNTRLIISPFMSVMKREANRTFVRRNGHWDVELFIKNVLQYKIVVSATVGILIKNEFTRLCFLFCCYIIH